MAVGMIGIKGLASQFKGHHGGKYCNKITSALNTIGKNGIRTSPVAS